MGLDFNAATRYVNMGTQGNTALPQDYTILAWVYMPSTAWAGYASMVGSRIIVANWQGFVFNISYQSGQDGGIQYYIVRNSSWSFQQTINTVSGVVTGGKWEFVGMQASYTNDSSDYQKIFYGDLVTSASEPTYGTKTMYVGATWPSLATDNYYIGNHAASASNFYFRGKIAWYGMWTRLLTLGEIIDQQYNPHVTPNCNIFTHLGSHGITSQPNLAGNGYNGTIYSGANADHVPLKPWFGVDRRPTFTGGYFQAVSGAATPTGAITKQTNKRVGAY